MFSIYKNGKKNEESFRGDPGKNNKHSILHKTKESKQQKLPTTEKQEKMGQTEIAVRPYKTLKTTKSCCGRLGEWKDPLRRSLRFIVKSSQI